MANEWINRFFAHPYSGMLPSNDLDEFQMHYAKRKKADAKVYTLHHSTYIVIWKEQKYRERILLGDSWGCGWHSREILGMVEAFYVRIVVVIIQQYAVFNTHKTT